MRPTLTPICAVGDVLPGTARCFVLDGWPPVALFNLGGTFYATANACTHQRASLAEGEIDGDEVICPRHFQVFHIPTGEAREGITTTALDTYEVALHNGTVYLERA